MKELTPGTREKLSETFSIMMTCVPKLCEYGYTSDRDTNEPCFEFEMSYSPSRGLSLVVEICDWITEEPTLFISMEGDSMEYWNPTGSIIQIDNVLEMCGNEEIYFQRSTVEDLLDREDLELMVFYYNWICDGVQGGTKTYTDGD